MKSASFYIAILFCVLELYSCSTVPVYVRLFSQESNEAVISENPDLLRSRRTITRPLFDFRNETNFVWKKKRYTAEIRSLSTNDTEVVSLVTKKDFK